MTFGRCDLPVQRFEPMTKDYPTFDCDAHIVEPPQGYGNEQRTTLPKTSCKP